MLKIVKYFLDFYGYCFEELSDPRTRNFLLTYSIFPTVLIIVLYLKFVLNWGPSFMKNRKPFYIEKILIVYNIIQILSSAYIAYLIIYYAYILGGYSLLCQHIDRSNSLSALKIVHVTQYYYLIKIVDLLDTVFFVLRKKWDQITFLHVYHHTGMVVLGFIGVRFFPGGHSIFLGVANSIVHVVMYTYYLLALLRKTQNFWWKKYITQLQIIQFFLIALSYLSLVILPDCGYPKWIGFVMLLQNAFMTSMFMEFYYKTYIKKSSKKSSLKAH